MKTFFPEIVAYWDERGHKSSVLYERNGLKMYEIDVAQERIDAAVTEDVLYKSLEVSEDRHQYDVIENRFFNQFYYAEIVDFNIGSNKDSVIHVGVPKDGGEEVVVAVFATKDDLPGTGIVDKERKLRYIQVSEPNQVVEFLALVLDMNTKAVGFCVHEEGSGEAVEVYGVETLIHVILRKGIADGTLNAMEVIQSLRRGHSEGGVVDDAEGTKLIGAKREGKTLH